MIRFIDLCAGIGGGRLGLENNGFTCVGFSEILKNSINVYKQFYDTSNEKELGDLTKLTKEKIPECEMLIAGFPCQSYSIQGLRKGLDDERGQIIFHIRNILKEKNIKYFLLENVKGLVNHNKGKTLHFIVELLEDAGYHVYYKVLKSNDFGLPQKRERIYFIGIRKDLPHTDYTFPSSHYTHLDLKECLIESEPKYEITDLKWFNSYINNKYNYGKYEIEDILSEEYLIVDTRQSDLRFFREYAPTLRTGRSGIWYVKNGKFRKLSGRESLLLQGFPHRLYHKAKNYSDSMLLQQTGNAMSVTVIDALARELKKVMEINGDI